MLFCAFHMLVALIRVRSERVVVDPCKMLDVLDALFQVSNAIYEYAQ